MSEKPQATEYPNFSDSGMTLISTSNLTDLKSEVERLKVELERAKADRNAEGMRVRSELLPKLEAMKRERDEAQAAAAVMREAILAQIQGKSIREYMFCQFTATHGNIALQAWISKLQDSVISTTAGTAFLARMAEAEWLVKNSIPNDSVNAKRRDAFLKGEGVKA